jgi:L-aminopeptidase/D-esterase-like protein
VPAGGATTIGALVTDAPLTKAQATRLAQVAHDGLARTIRPVHTPLDGDTLFVAGTGTATPDASSGPDLLLLSMLAAEAAARAVLAGVRAAAPGLRIDGQWLPAWADRR